jgi:probable O-glycosylation ligase (exosortase A-associated)
VGIWVIVFTFFSKERFRFGLFPMLLFVILGHSLISTIQSEAFSWALGYWIGFAKAIAISYMLVVLVTDEKRLRTTLLVIAFSLGFEGAKQGWAQIFINPGGLNTNAWATLGDNNGVAIGMLMLVSFFTALARTAPFKIERWVERFFAVGIIYRGLSTYSRGGFLACAGLGLHYLFRAKNKFVAVIAIAAVGFAIVKVLPEEYWDRMNTIRPAAESASEELSPEEKEATADESAEGRLHFWNVAVVMAKANPIFGVGHNAFNPLYDNYDFSLGEYGRRRSVHSAWFGIVSELGFLGLLIYLAIIARAFIACRRARRLAKLRPDLAHMAAYAAAVEGALVACGIGSTFYPFQYNEMLWHTLALSIVIDGLVAERLAEPLPAARPVEPAVAPVPAGIAARPAIAPSARTGSVALRPGSRS